MAQWSDILAAIVFLLVKNQLAILLVKLHLFPLFLLCQVPNQQKDANRTQK
jgi:hypothetical protein